MVRSPHNFRQDGTDLGDLGATVDTTSRVLFYRWVIFLVLALAYMSAFFHRICPAVVALDLQRAFGLSGGFMGLLASAYFYSYAFIQFPAGVLSDTLGPRKAVSLFLVIGGIGSVILGLAPNVGTAVFGRVLVGLGAGMVFTPTMKILSQWFRVHEFTPMTGILLTMGGVGALTGAAPMALLSGWLGWRASFGVVGLATLALAAAVWGLVRNRPKDMGWPSPAEIDHVGAHPLPVPRRISLWDGVRRVVTEKRVWPVATWAFLVMGTFFGFGGLWAGPYLMDVYGMSRAEAGNVLNMLAVGIIFGSPFMSFLSETVLRSRKKVLMLSSVCLVAVMTFLCMFPSGLPKVSLYFIFLIFSVSSLAPGVIGVTTIKELFPIEITGTAVGTVNQFPFLGAAVLQLVLGWILDAYPKAQVGSYSIEAYSGMLLFLLVVALMGALCTVFMKDTYVD